MVHYLVFFMLPIALADRDWSQITPLDVHPFLNLETYKPNLRITNGVEADPHSIPYQVGLFLDRRGFCGGSLVSDKFVLTAAHCVDGRFQVEIVFGAHDITEEEFTQKSVKSEDFIIHEGWDRRRLINDIALIKLPKTVKFTDQIQPVHLREHRACPDRSLDGIQAQVSGWGRISDKKRKLAQLLRYTTNDIISNKQCQRHYGKRIKSTHICLSGEDERSSCNGDSGGPLTVYEDGDNVLVGIVSFGSGKGCAIETPSVYTRISCYLDWIEENIADDVF